MSPFLIVMAVMLLMVAFFSGLMIYKKRDKKGFDGIPDGAAVFIGVLFCFGLIYYLTSILTMIFLDAMTNLTDRILLPLSISWILFSSMILYVFLASNAKDIFLKRVFIISLVLSIGGTNFFQTLRWAFHRYRVGVGFEGIGWDHSGIIAETKKIPLDKIIYTNNPNALYVAAQRQAHELVPKMDMMSMKPNTLYSVFMMKMKNDLMAQKAVLVYCNSMCMQCGLPSIEDIQKEVPLKSTVKVTDGAIYTFAS
jgi:hypothetical protein